MRRRVAILQLLLVLVFVTRVHAQRDFETTRQRAKQFEPIILAAAQEYAVDPHLLWTVAYLESRFEPQAVSYKDGQPCARGLMQFVPATARRYGLVNPHHPKAAIEAAARYLRDLMELFRGRKDLVLAAYNAGEGSVQAFLYGRKLVLKNGKVINPRLIRTSGVPPYVETRDYVANGYRIYQRLSESRILTKSIGSQEPQEPLQKTDQAESSIYTSNTSRLNAASARPKHLSLYAN